MRIDAQGNRTSYVYDLVGQRIQRKYPDGTRTTWTYDSVGNPLVIAATAGRFTRTYDAVNQVRQLKWPSGEILTWTYDAAGQRGTRETSTGTITYTYNGNSQLTRLVNEYDEVTTISYDAAGREVLKSLANGTRATLIYDAAGQTKSVASLQATEDVISRFTYLYDPVGNRIQECRENGDLRVFGYDPTNQLISEQRTEGEGWETLTADQWGGMSLSDWGMLPAGGGAGPITTYVYDPVGNRLVLNADGELTTSTYDAANRLRTAEDLSGITTYTFDANGNQRTVETPTGEITTYSWTYENQLAQQEEPDDIVTTNIYAPTNRKGDELRVTKETDAGVTNFIYDDQNLIQEVDDTGAVEAEYTLNPQPYGDLVSQRRESESTFYNYDALGSAQSLTDQNGTVENDYTYGAFGNILAQSGSTDNSFTWVGELGYYQEADGNYLLRQRWYGEEINRFFGQDPLGFHAGDENQYRYAANSPLITVDPNGTEYFTFHLVSSGRYAVYYVPEHWTGIDLDHFFVGYSDSPGSYFFNLPTGDITRPGVNCTISKDVFVQASFPATSKGWDIFFTDQCNKTAASQGSVPPLSSENASCPLGMSGATMETCGAGADVFEASVGGLFYAVGIDIIISYFPYGSAIKKLGAASVTGVKYFCEKGRRGLRLLVKTPNCPKEVPFDLAGDAYDDFIKDLRKKGDSGNVNAKLLIERIDEIAPKAGGGSVSTLQGNIPQADKWIRDGGRVVYGVDGSMTYIKNGVSIHYNSLGYPDFSKYLYKGTDGLSEVRIKLTGSRRLDEVAANAAAGFKQTPDGFTWHHNEDCGLMQLVDERVHGTFWHSGGFSLNK